MYVSFVNINRIHILNHQSGNVAFTQPAHKLARLVGLETFKAPRCARDIRTCALNAYSHIRKQ